jgi:hypothetical protein
MDTAMLVGRVADSSGAAIVKAHVELVDIDRNTKSSAQTNNTGLYRFTNAKPGHYRMNVSAPGFKTVALASLTIYVQDDIQQDFRMAAGSPLESVTMVANGMPVETTGTVGTVVDQTLVRELPLNGRSFQTLFQLTPGVVITSTTFASQGQFSVNGQRTNTNYFMIDGVSANVAIAAGVNTGQSAGGSLPAVTAFGGTNSLVSTDDVQEFAVLSSGYSPEFGRMPGAQVSIVTRSGTNEFHGEIFDYVRNDIFDANDWFANRDNLKRAALRQNDYGGVLGGPIYRDRTFFFASYEGLRLRQPTSSESDVPSLTARNSALPSMKPLFNAYPLPNGTEEGNGLAHATYAFSNPSGLDTVSLRVDHSLGEALSTFARYDHATSNREERGATINSLSTVTDTHFALQTLTGGVTYRISPTTINDLRFNWSGSSATSADQIDHFGGAVPLSSERLFPPSFNQQNGLFQFVDAIVAQHRQLSLGTNVSNVQRQLNFVDSASYQVGNHIFKCGIDFRRMSPTSAPAAYSQQSGFADINAALAGHALLVAIGSNTTVNSTFVNFSAYAESTWKPTTRLDLTYGIRWDYSPTPTGKGSNGLRPIAVRGFDDLPELSLAGAVTPLYRARPNNVAPRLGIAWQPRGSPKTETTIRAGLGVYYDLGNGPVGNALDGTHFPFSAQRFLLDVQFPLNSGNSSSPLISGDPPFGTIQAFPTVLKLPYSFNFSVSVDQSIGKNQTVSVDYLGTKGHRLLRTEEYVGGEAGVPPQFTQLLFTNNAAYSTYNSLQLRFQRRASANVNVIASYTFSRSLDNVSTDATFDAIPTQFLDSRTDYGSSDFDIRHNATLGLAYSVPTISDSHFARAVLSGWSFDQIVMMHSPPPINVLVSRDIGFGTYSFRPDLVEGMPLYVNDSRVPGGRRLNLAALAVPAEERQGTLQRNSFRGFRFFQVDLALQRRFLLADRILIHCRVEAFNVFNHANFSPESGQMGAVDANGKVTPQAGFGISQTLLAQGLEGGELGTLSSGFSPLYQIGSARSIQLTMKVQF